MGLMKLFSKMDLEFIQRSLGRNPGKKELNILYKAVEPVLKLRDRIPARYFSQEPTDIHQSLRYELREINIQGQWTGTHYLMRECSLLGVWPKQLSFIWLFEPPKKTIRKIHDFEKNLTHEFAPVITHHLALDAPRKKGGKVFALAILGKNNPRKKVHSQQLLGFIKIPKPGKTLINEKKIKYILNQSALCVEGIALDGDHGKDLRKLLNKIPNSASLDLAFPKRYKKGDGIIILQGTSDSAVKDLLNEMSYEYQRVGCIRSEPVHTLYFSDVHERRWPKGLTLISVHGKDIAHSTIKPATERLIKHSSKKPALLTIIKKMIKAGYPKVTKKQNFGDTQQKIIQVSDMRFLQTGRDSFFYGIRSVADVVRKIALDGSHIAALRIMSNVDDFRFLEGQQTVIHSFDLKNKADTHILDTFELNQHQVIGLGSFTEPVEFNHDTNDFLVLLGGVKGEMEDSLYEEISGICHFGGKKSFDSVMEYNINQALVQSVSYSIIKNALAIEKGGLVCTLLALYRYLESQFGIKIHITSRLKTEELLFGETYASALVLIGERELMEFQRICMLHSVPCSTIGRLQLKKVISINNQLIIPEKILNLLPSE